MKSLVYSQNSSKLNEISQGLDPKTTFALTQNLVSSLQCFKENTFETIILNIKSHEELDQNISHISYNILKPNGEIKFVFDSQLEQIQSLSDKLIIAGFKLAEINSENQINARKPGWAGNGVASLKKKNVVQSESKPVKIDVENGSVKKVNPFAKVTLNNQAELVDDDNLLANETEYKKIEKPEDCSTKPKACKDCSCGRAELEAQASNPNALTDNIEKGKVSSSCGNCYLGDAFRCSSCPYKGLPAFKPGDKVKLDLSKDSVGGILNEGNEVVVSNGKVKLQI